MRIMAEINSTMEQDIVIANTLIESLNRTLSDIKKVFDFKKNSVIRTNELENNKQELLSCLEQLRQGIDPLKEKRQQIVQELYSENLSHPAHEITEYLAK